MPTTHPTPAPSTLTAAPVCPDCRGTLVVTLDCHRSIGGWEYEAPCPCVAADASARDALEAYECADWTRVVPGLGALVLLALSSASGAGKEAA